MKLGLVVLILGILIVAGIAAFMVVKAIWKSTAGSLEGLPCRSEYLNYAESACVDGNAVVCYDGRTRVVGCLHGCGEVSGLVYKYGCVSPDAPMLQNADDLFAKSVGRISEKSTNPLGRTCEDLDDSYCYQGNSYYCHADLGKFGTEVCQSANTDIVAECQQFPGGGFCSIVS